MRRRTAFLWLAVVLLPGTARGDAGTPLLMAAFLHLTVGNALIGWLEGLLLARMFGLQQRRCIVLMILANYVSAWLGLPIVHILEGSQQQDLYTAPEILPVLIALTYPVTLMLEWPFVAWCFWRRPAWFADSLRASLFVQTLSYLVLFSVYWLVSDHSLYSEFNVVPPAEQSLPDNICVYYISSEDGHVYSRSGQEKAELLARLGSKTVEDFLLLQPSKADGAVWDLVVATVRRRMPEDTKTVIEAVMTSPTEGIRQFQGYGGWDGALLVGSATQSPWRFWWAHWSTIGLNGKNSTTGERIRVAFGNPFMGWDFYRAIHLPGDVVLVQLGKDQLCLLDVPKRRISLWERGYGPIAVETKTE